MKQFFCLFLFLSISYLSYGKGCSGSYFISGQAYASDIALLKNMEIVCLFGTDSTRIQTDSNGHYELEIPWTNACPSEENRKQYREENKRLNPEFIYLLWNGQEIRLRNNWTKLADCFQGEKEQRTWKKDLYF